MRLSVNNFKPGITFQYEGDIFVILSSQHSKQARSSAVVKTKLKNLRTGTILVKVFSGGEKVLKAHISKTKKTFLYQDEEFVYLIDEESLEQIAVPKEKLLWELNFLKESSKLLLRTFEGDILDVELPANVELEVVEAPDAVRGNTTQNPTKKIRLETGYELEAPLFVNQGDFVVVDTVEGKYVGRQTKSSSF